MPDRARYWQDIQPGETFATRTLTISREDILEFAADFDPQPYHLDSEAADASIFGGLCASGWHVTALMMRLLTDTFDDQRIELLGSNGVAALRWRKPVYAGDTLSAAITVAARSDDSDDPRFGYIECDIQVHNQQQEEVIKLSTSLMIANRPEQAHA
jgi:acyl dehydratase